MGLSVTYQIGHHRLRGYFYRLLPLWVAPPFLKFHEELNERPHAQTEVCNCPPQIITACGGVDEKCTKGIKLLCPDFFLFPKNVKLIWESLRGTMGIRKLEKEFESLQQSPSPILGKITTKTSPRSRESEVKF